MIPSGVEKYTIVRVLSPYDLAGTNPRLWRYRGNRPLRLRAVDPQGPGR